MATNSNKKAFNNAKKAVKRAKKHSTRLLVCLVIIAVLVGAFFVSLSFENKIDEALGLRKIEVYNKGDMVSLGAMNIHFIDVGQGDACLIELPDNRTMLIDAGENNPEVEKKLEEYMDKVNSDRAALDRPEIEYFDFVIATHSDSDHVGSMDFILELYPAATFYRPNEQSTYTGYTDPALAKSGKNGFWGGENGVKDTVTYQKAIKAGYQSHKNFVEGIVTNPHDNSQNCIKPDSAPTADDYYEVNFYGPIKPKYESYNDYSPIIIAEYKDRRVALSGDSELDGETDFADAVRDAQSGSRYFDLKSPDFYVDIYNVGHHGSNSSSNAVFLDVLTSGSANMEQVYATISCGKDNSYGHPTSKTLARLDEYGFLPENILRTDQIGDIIFTFGYYQGHATAFVDRGELVSITYPTEVMGITIKYRTIGIAALIILAIILLIIGATGKKPTKKAKTAPNNNKPTNKPNNNTKRK